ncbi:hypothetical protein [Nitratireductor pacificus]|nr:hypothetical protein [Nitratireductor pacificus]
MLDGESTFLNADLVLCSDEDIAGFSGGLVEQGFLLLFNGPWEGGPGAYRSVLELDHPADDAHFVPVIENMLAVLEALSGDRRRLWDGLVARELDLGFEAGGATPDRSWRLPQALVARIAAAGLDLTVTIYTRSSDAP